MSIHRECVAVGGTDDLITGRQAKNWVSGVSAHDVTIPQFGLRQWRGHVRKTKSTQSIQPFNGRGPLEFVVRAQLPQRSRELFQSSRQLRGQLLRAGRTPATGAFSWRRRNA